MPLAALGGLGMFLVNRVLLAGALHPDIDCHPILVDLVVITKGLETFGDDLQSHRVAEWQHVDDGFAILVGLQLHVAFVPLALHWVEDDCGIFNGLAIGVPHHGDLNARGGRGRLVLAAALGGVLLGAHSERRED